MTSKADAFKHRFPGRETARLHRQYKPDLHALAAGDKVLLADLVALMRRALGGSVRDSDCVCYGVGWPRGEEVHEIGLNVGDDHYRIYFGDPRDIPSSLLFLLPSWKPSSRVDEAWHVIQNGHIAEAKRRCSEWLYEFHEPPP